MHITPQKNILGVCWKWPARFLLNVVSCWRGLLSGEELLELLQLLLVG